MINDLFVILSWNEFWCARDMKNEWNFNVVLTTMQWNKNIEPETNVQCPTRKISLFFFAVLTSSSFPRQLCSLFTFLRNFLIVMAFMTSPLLIIWVSFYFIRVHKYIAFYFYYSLHIQWLFRSIFPYFTSSDDSTIKTKCRETFTKWMQLKEIFSISCFW